MDLKFLILIPYFNRPVTVVNALESIAAQTYERENITASFIDDSEVHGFWTSDCRLNNVHYIHTEDTQEAKLARGGSMFGEFMNQEMLKSGADICFMVNDDDAIQPDYCEKLNKFYLDNPEVTYSYCDVVTYDPSVESWSTKVGLPPSDWFLNTHTHPHHMGNSKDSSQGSWRLSCIKEGTCRFPAPLTHALDYHFWCSLYSVYGPAQYNGINGAIKGIWSKQLGNRAELLDTE